MLALLLNHWPPLEAELGSSGGALKKAAAVEPKVWASNAALAAKLWAKLQLPFPLSAEQLLEGSPVDGLMLLAYAYQVTPTTHISLSHPQLTGIQVIEQCFWLSDV
jgi:hypothetical protein